MRQYDRLCSDRARCVKALKSVDAAIAHEACDVLHILEIERRRFADAVTASDLSDEQMPTARSMIDSTGFFDALSFEEPMTPRVTSISARSMLVGMPLNKSAVLRSRLSSAHPIETSRVDGFVYVYIYAFNDQSKHAVVDSVIVGEDLMRTDLHELQMHAAHLVDETLRNLGIGTDQLDESETK